MSPLVCGRLLRGHLLRAVLALAVALSFSGVALSLRYPGIADAAPAPAPAAAAVASNPCAGDNFSPASRTLAPASVFATAGAVSNPASVLSGQVTRLTGNGSAVTLDFGQEVGGLVTLTFAGSSDASQSVGLAFSESSQYAGDSSDASNGGGGADGAIYAAVAGAGSYTMPADKLRGGFRYLTLFLNSAGWPTSAVSRSTSPPRPP